MTFFSIFILFLVTSIFLIDFFPQFNTWQSRIKIGRFASNEVWKAKVLDISKKWLNNTPTIKLTDNDRLIIIDMLKGNYKRSAIQSWQEAALFLGLSQHYRSSGDIEVKSILEKFTDRKIAADGSWKIKPTESDQAILAYAFLDADFLDFQKLKPAMDETYEMILSLKGEDRTVAYKSHKRDFRFVDTVGFISPFLVNYGLKYNHSEAVDLGIEQILEYQKFGMMEHENIPCHTYDVRSKIPVGLFGWGRGLGWFMIGLADSWKALPQNNPHKTELTEIMKKTVKSVIKFQIENGGFHWLMFDPASRLDSSATATLAYFFSVAEKIPEISEDCKKAKEKALNYLQSVTRRNGAIDFSQGDTKGIGVYSQNFDILPFTQGFCLRTVYS